VRDLETIPIVSIRDNQVVLAANGEYIPLSQFEGHSHIPTDVIGKLAEDNENVMIIDLNAIEGRPLQVDALQSLPSNIEVWMDAGVRVVDDLYDIFMNGAERAVASTKSLESMDDLGAMLDISDQLIFEIVFDGGIVSPDAPVRNSSPHSLVTQALDMGCTDILFTTLSRDYIMLDGLPDEGNYFLYAMEWNDSYPASDILSGRVVSLKEVLGLG
jgi:phosphoribosylformimino-5-aminoimidazole carboxamide ribonucleotide (ProFAR) isomerase